MYPNTVVTFLPVFESTVLLIRRATDEKNFPGLWAFPGGKVHVGETVVDALVRELGEETELKPSGPLAFLNTYWFGTSAGITFAVPVTSSEVRPHGFARWVWLHSLDELHHYDRVPGIDNHLVAAFHVIENDGYPMSVNQANLTPEKYLNAG